MLHGVVRETCAPVANEMSIGPHKLNPDKEKLSNTSEIQGKVTEKQHGNK
jgi:hypothetical protein